MSVQISAWAMRTVLPESDTHILDKLCLIMAADVAGRDGRTLLWSEAEHAAEIAAIAKKINIAPSLCEASFDRLLRDGYVILGEVEDFGRAYSVDLAK